MRNPQKGWSDCPRSSAEETLRAGHGRLPGKGRRWLKPGAAAPGRVLKLQGEAACRGGVPLPASPSRVTGLINHPILTARRTACAGVALQRAVMRQELPIHLPSFAPPAASTAGCWYCC